MQNSKQQINQSFDSAILTGKSRSHLVAIPSQFSSSHYLHREALSAFLSLQHAAKQAGFCLEPASSYRDFSRQQLIWNSKFNGERRVHDAQGHTIDVTMLDDWTRCEAILAWSALPGGSRHHWGTEIDIYDPLLLGEDRSLQLEPWEYETGGYFAELSEWLIQNMAQFDFTLPFLTIDKNLKVGREPWHISYQPFAEIAQQQFTPEILFDSWKNEEIAGKAILETNQERLFREYFVRSFT